MPIETLYIDQDVSERQTSGLKKLKDSRDNTALRTSLAALRQAAHSGENLMPYFIACSREYATLGEMCNELRAVFGTYVEPAF